MRILEEPPAHAFFILNTDTPAQLLPTIRSRCVLIKFGNETPLKSCLKPDSDDLEGSGDSGYEQNSEFDLTDIINTFFTALESGNTEIIKFMFLLEKLNKEQFGLFLSKTRHSALSLLRSHSREGGILPEKTITLLDKLLVRAKELLDQNVNIGHISGFICASLVK